MQNSISCQTANSFPEIKTDLFPLTEALKLPSPIFLVYLQKVMEVNQKLIKLDDSTLQSIYAKLKPLIYLKSSPVLSTIYRLHH